MDGLQVGRIVHYVARGSADGMFPKACRAAIITEVINTETGAVALCVLNPTGMFFNTEVFYHHELGTSLEPGTWHWPEKV